MVGHIGDRALYWWHYWGGVRVMSLPSSISLLGEQAVLTSFNYWGQNLEVSRFICHWVECVLYPVVGRKKILDHSLCLRLEYCGLICTWDLCYSVLTLILLIENHNTIWGIEDLLWTADYIFLFNIQHYEIYVFWWCICVRFMFWYFLGSTTLLCIIYMIG